MCPNDEPLAQFPADWDRTLDDLFAELESGQRKTIGHPEMAWAKAYERSQIPAGFRFPRQGDRYASNQDQTVTYLTAWSAPFTGSGEAVLRQGDEIWVHDAPSSTAPIGVYAIPVAYGELAARMVPQCDRQDPKFGGFYFFFKTVELNQHFTLIQTDFTGAGE